MKKYSKNLEFEKLHDTEILILMLKTMEKQKIVSENTKVNQDFIGIVKEHNLYSVSILEIREGRLINKKDFDFFHSLQVSLKRQQICLRIQMIKHLNIMIFRKVSKAVMREYYSILNDSDIPKSIILAVLPDDKNIYETWLSSRLGKKVVLSAPKNKKEEEILALAQKNAEFNIEQLKLKEFAELQNDYNEVGAYIQEKLGLKNFPHTIECYDISHIQGTNTVASRVFLKNGMPKNPSTVDIN